MLAIPEVLKKRSTLIAGGVAVILIIGAFCAGRFSTPVKVVEKTKTEYKDRIEYKDRMVTQFVDRTITLQGPTHIIEHTVEKPGGEKVTDRTEDRGPATISANVSGSSDSTSAATGESTTKIETTKIVEARSSWGFELAGWWSPKKLEMKPKELEVAAEKRILGGTWVGLGVKAPTDKLTSLEEYNLGLRLRGEF